MTRKNKIIAATLAVLTLGATALATTTPADAHWHGGWGFGGGLIAGTLLSAAVVNSNPGYVYYGPRCSYVPQYNNWGQYVGTAKFCRY